jgi:ADP-heptose:LPS heptosyltransferase
LVRKQIAKLRRIALVKPCCIGDVIFTTPLLLALRRGYPDAQIDWWLSNPLSAEAIQYHPALTQVIRIGAGANPAAKPRGLLELALKLRRGGYDMLVVPDRSVKLSLAALLTGIRTRVGLDSGGRGFGYTVRARIDPKQRRHEAEIYLDLARALDLSTDNCYVNVPPDENSRAAVAALMQDHNISTDRPLLLIHPGGGVNPGMQMTSKRWPLENVAVLAAKYLQDSNGLVVLLGSEKDKHLTKTIVELLKSDQVVDFAGLLTLPQIGALAALPQVQIYIGNDTGATHLAAAAGARVLAIFGPSDPVRYAPFAPNAAYVWKPVDLPAEGVAGKSQPAFDWGRDGVGVSEVWARIEGGN